MSDHFDPYHVWLAIPPEESAGGKPNHYRLLGLRLFEANPDVISNALDQRRAYLRSVSAGKRAAQSQQLLNEVSAAGVCLLDADKKAKYDNELRAKTPATPAPLAADTPFSQPLQAPLAISPRAARIGPVARPYKKSRSSPAAVAAAAVVGAGLLAVLVGAGAWLTMRRPDPDAALPQPRIEPSAPDNPPGRVADDSTPGAANAVASSNATNDSPGRPAASQRLAMVFTGRESVRVPLPAEIVAPDSPFTIELWARWDPYEPAGRLLGAGSLRVHSTSPPDAAPPGAFNLVHLGAQNVGTFRRTDIERSQWAHVAVVRQPENIELFVNGKLKVRFKLKAGFAISSPLVLGEVAGAQNVPVAGFCGLIRDVRVSKTARYTAPFTPVEVFDVDDHTVTLLDIGQRQALNEPIKNAAGRAPPAELVGTRLISLTPNGGISVDMPDGAVDLLKTSNVSRDTLEGDNYQTASFLETRVAQGRSRVLLPYRPPAEYEVELEMTRQEGEGGAFLGLEIAGRPAILAIDISDAADRRTGLLPGTLSGLVQSPQLKRTPPLLATGERRLVIVKVQINDTDFAITVQQGGAPMANLNGPLDSLACPPEFAIPLSHGMSLGSIGAKIRFDRVMLRTTNVDFTPQVLASMPHTPPRGKASVPQRVNQATKTASAATKTGSSPPAAAGVLPGSRHPVPSGDYLAKAVEEARKIYESDFKSASRSPQRAALAKRIFESGKSTASDPTAKYVLIDLARKVFIQSGEVADALAAADALESDFDVPRDELAAATVEALDDAQLSAEQRLQLAKEAADLADAAIDADQFERADKLSIIASQSARGQRDAEFKQDMAQRRAVITRLVKEWRVVKPSLEKLKTDPADKAANLAAGKFYCFALEDFNTGLKNLAAAGDPLLTVAAERDLAAQSGDAAKRMDAALAWQKAAAKIPDRDDKLAVQRREKWFVQQAASGLSGVEQIKANKRLEELKDIGQIRDKSKTGVRPARSKIRTGSSP